MRWAVRIAVAIAGIGLAPGVATAGDKVAIGAAPAWVVPVATPAAPAMGPGDAAVTVLLQDQQLDLRPGVQARYAESAYRINTPDGLSAGAVALAWNPDLETITVHKLQIRRGNTLIDVLASGQTFTIVRREANLENAVLDGELTATMQPEGLQVGDILDLAITIVRRDPALGQHIETAAATWNANQIARAHFRAQWPQGVAMRVRSAGGLPTPKPAKHGETTIIDFTVDGLQPAKVPSGAPPRFRYGRMIEISDLSDWSGVSALMVPLYAKAATLAPTSPLKAEIEKITAATPDPKLRAQAALALVQDRVRYVFLAINDGGLVPADADTTWSRRFGDCKGKTVLLLALLQGMGIDAVPILVSTSQGDGIDQRLPMVGVFDHVIVRATIGGRVYWLDGTRQGDRRIDDIVTPAFYWGVPLAPGGAALVPLRPVALAQPETDIALKLDATGGLLLPAKAHAERIMRGDAAVYTSQQLANLAAAEREQTLRDFWKGRYDFITPGNVASTFDPVTRELRLMMDGSAKMEWNDGFYQTDDTSVGYKADFSRDAGTDRDAPFAVTFPSYVRVRETVLLPPGGFTLYNGQDVDQHVAGMAYVRHGEIKGNIFTVEETERSVAAEFPATAAPTAQDTLRALFKKSLFIQRPDDYALTEAELAIVPTTANGFVDRGNALLSRGRFDAAITDFDKALTIEPKNVIALADRGLTYVWKGDPTTARRDLDAAAVIEPRNAVMWRARGLMALRTDDAKGAIAAFTTALEIEPKSAWALQNRAAAYRAAAQNALAAADAAAAITLTPHDVDLYLLLSNASRGAGDRATSLRQASAVVAANPDQAYAHVVAARILGYFGDTPGALHAFDRAIAIKPEAYIYINRAQVRPKTDRAGRMADLDAAIRLDPTSVEAMVDKAQLQRDSGDYPAAIATLAAARAANPDNHGIALQRGIVYARAGQATAAARDFASARAAAKTPGDLNALCWEKAIAGIDLPGALGECDAALAKAPNAPDILDSRGFVLLRLARYDEAIAAYDKSLAINANQSASLYGRAVAEAHKGAGDKAKADLVAAMEADPHVTDRFAGYGVALPKELAASAVTAGL